MLRLLAGISTLSVHSRAFFPKLLPVSPLLALANTWFLCTRVDFPRNLNRLKKYDLWYDDLWNEYLGDRVKFVFSPYVILCGRLGSKHQLTTQHFVLLPVRSHHRTRILWSQGHIHVYCKTSSCSKVFVVAWVAFAFWMCVLGCWRERRLRTIDVGAVTTFSPSSSERRSLCLSHDAMRRRLNQRGIAAQWRAARDIPTNHTQYN